MTADHVQRRTLTPLQQRGMRIIERLKGITQKDSQQPTGRQPRIGVALGGGSARGLTHIPFIEAMDEMGIKPDVIAGTSIGGLIGAGWANGMTGAELRDHSHAVLGTMRLIAGKLWTTQVRGISGIFQNGLSVQLDARKVVDAFVPEGFPTEFEALKIPLRVVATDFQSWHQVVYSTGSIRDALGGSIAIPTLFKPVAFDGHLLVDGGVVNPLPLDQAALDSDILIGIDVNGDPSVAVNRNEPKPLDVWFGSAQIMMHSLIAHMIAAYPPDIFVRPQISMFGAHEFWRAKEIIASAEHQKDIFKHQLTKKIEDFIATQQRSSATVHANGLRQPRK